MVLQSVRHDWAQYSMIQYEWHSYRKRALGHRQTEEWPGESIARTQIYASKGERPLKEPWTWTSSLRNWGKRHFCCLSPLVWDICYGSLSKLMNCVLGWSVQGEKVGRIYLQALISYWLMAYFTRYKQGFPDDSDGKESACNAGDLG